MVYRGFTWNVTYSEMANIVRILNAHRGCKECRPWDASISEALALKISTVMEVSPDGTSSTHGPADA